MSRHINFKGKIKKINFLIQLNNIRIRMLTYIKKLLTLLFDSSKKRWLKNEDEVIREYWADRNNDKNEYLLKKVKKEKPNSILEIGSNCGNKLVYLSKYLRNVNFMGIDIQERAVELGKSWIKEEKILNIELKKGEAEYLSIIDDDSYDLVFTWAVLIYIGPREIQGVAQNMLRIAKKSIILLEMQSNTIKKPLGEFCLPGNWKRDYKYIFMQLGIPEERITIESIHKDIWSPGGGDAACIIIKK